MKKVLIPTDFSDSALKASGFATSWLGENIELFLLNTFELVHSTSEMIISIDDILKRNSEDGLEKEKRMLENLYPGLLGSITTISKFGPLVTSINQVVEECRIDLIVMGTEGSKGIEKILFGSNASDVIRKVSIPVIVLPETTQIKPFKKLVLAVDGTDEVDLSAISRLKELIHNQNVEVDILTVDSGSSLELTDRNRLIVCEALKGISHSCHGSKSQDVAGSIEEYSKGVGADMIVLMPHRYPFVKGLFHNSVSKNIANDAVLPILALR